MYLIINKSLIVAFQYLLYIIQGQVLSTFVNTIFNLHSPALIREGFWRIKKKKSKDLE